MNEINNEIIVQETRFKKRSDNDPYLDIMRISDVTEHDRSNDNVEISISDGHYIRFRLRDLLDILGFERREIQGGD